MKGEVMEINKLMNYILDEDLASFNRDNREPLRKIFPKAQEITRQQWEEVMEQDSIDFEPIKTIIGEGEYGNGVLIIFASKYVGNPHEEEIEFYLQYIYGYKGGLE